MSKTLLLFGSQGLLGQEIFQYFSTNLPKEMNIIPLSRFNAHLEIPEDIEDIFAKTKPDIVINAAALSDVDFCEENPEMAHNLNEKAPKKMADLCQKYGSNFLHISTDYVFNGKKGNYAEDDKTNPINVYGISKNAGEKAVRKALPSACIIRTARLFGDGRENTVKHFAWLAKKKKEISAIKDERGNFTFTTDLAKGLCDLFLQKNIFPEGTFHLINEGSMTPLELAEFIVTHKESLSCVTPVSAESLERIAKRPQDTSLKNTKLPLLPPLADALSRFLS